MSQDNPRLGIPLMIATMFVFAMQDGISRHLAGTYNVTMIVTIRYWAFAVFAVFLAARAPGGLRQIARTDRPVLQIARGLLLALEICIMVLAFVLLGLVESLAVFASYPLLLAALSGPLLGERAGWRRWTAIAVGFLGVLVILKPGAGVFSAAAIVPLISATLFAVYSLLTRLAARSDPAMTSFFWTGIVGAIAMTPVGLLTWEPMTAPDWGWMLVLCATGALGHWLLIKTYEVAQATTVQPFAYFQLVFGSALGITVFGETLRANVALGTAIVIAAGLFTLWREAKARN